MHVLLLPMRVCHVNIYCTNLDDVVQDIAVAVTPLHPSLPKERTTSTVVTKTQRLTTTIDHPLEATTMEEVKNCREKVTLLPMIKIMGTRLAETS